MPYSLLDDGLRSGEKEITERWKKEYPDMSIRFVASKNGMWRVEL